MADPVSTRPEFVRQTALDAERGIVEKPLSAFERAYNLAAVHKLAILVALAAAWEIYARWLNNPLLFPTLHDTLVTLWDRVKDRQQAVKKNEGWTQKLPESDLDAAIGLATDAAGCEGFGVSVASAGAGRLCVRDSAIHGGIAGRGRSKRRGRGTAAAFETNAVRA